MSSAVSNHPDWCWVLAVAVWLGWGLAGNRAADPKPAPEKQTAAPSPDSRTARAKPKEAKPKPVSPPGRSALLATNGLRLTTFVDTELKAVHKTGLAKTLDYQPSAPVRSARWTGYLRVPRTGRYRLRIMADDAVRIWIDGKLVADHWEQKGIQTFRDSCRLVSGLSRIRVDWCNFSHKALLKVQWKGPGMVEESIPEGAFRLFAPDPRMVMLNRKALRGALVLFSRRRWTDALREFEAYPYDSVVAVYYMARCYEHLGQRAKARQAYQAFLQAYDQFKSPPRLLRPWRHRAAKALATPSPSATSAARPAKRM